MIGVIGAGAFGTALSLALGHNGAEVRLWARNGAQAAQMQKSRTTEGRLPGFLLPQTVTVTAEIGALADAAVILLAVPMQQLAGFLDQNPGVCGPQPLVACCKGMDLPSLRGPTAVIAAACPAAPVAVLTGPSFAADIARGLPTALTLACADRQTAHMLQRLLSTPVLRLYRTDDVTGAEMGGALKNVVAIAAGIVIGAGLGESARAAIITRGHAEILRMAADLGARPDTLAGLSGLGDLILTCTSPQSRNFQYGLALGAGRISDANVTVEGVLTTKAVSVLAAQRFVDMPIATMVAAVLDGKITIRDATDALLARPLKQE